MSARALAPVRAATLVVAAAWLVVPLVPVLPWSLAERWSFPAALPQAWGTGPWIDAAAAGLPGALLRSLLLGVAVAALAVPLGVLAGRVLGWRLVRRPRVVVAVLLVPLLLPPFAVSMGLDVVLLRAGVPEPLAVLLLLVTLAVPYTAYVSATAFARTSPRIEDQARALGATPRQATRRVVLPAVRGSLVIATLLAFLIGWSDYVVTLVIGGGQLVTAPILLGSAAAGSGNEAVVAVMALATVTPPLLLATLAARTRAVR